MEENETRLIELESRLAFQDDLINRLDGVVVALRAQVDGLQRRLIRLEAQLQEVAPALIKPQSEETPPPHY